MLEGSYKVTLMKYGPSADSALQPITTYNARIKLNMGPGRSRCIAAISFCACHFSRLI